MEVLHSRCCGLDVHKKSISACVMIREHGRLEKLERRFGTFTGELEDLVAWLTEHKVTHVAMEATGVYWKPVWNVLEGRFDLMLVNPQHIKALTGKKCDRRDASHLTELLQHGLLQGSFIPSAAIRHLRDLTRNRARTVQEAARIKSRVQKVLEEANVKLGSVATDVLGVSGRLMLNGLVAGKQDPEELADLAVGVLRKKRDQLVQALSGKVGDHHRLMLGKLLRALKTREVEIAEDETDIRNRIEPFRKAVLAWMQLPGIDEVTAWSLVAEMGLIWHRWTRLNRWPPGRASARAITRARVNRGTGGPERVPRGCGVPSARRRVAPHAPRSPTFMHNTLGPARGAVRNEH